LDFEKNVNYVFSNTATRWWRWWAWWRRRRWWLWVWRQWYIPRVKN